MAHDLAPALRIALAAGAASLFLLVACGGDDSSGTAAPAAATGAGGSPGDEGVLRFDGKDPAGRAFMAQAGGDIALPDDYPDDVPPYPGAEPTAVLSALGQTVVTFSSSDPAKEVQGFYKDKLSGSGWAIENEASVGGRHMLSAAKAGRRASVTISANEGKTQINVALSGG